ncbi:MAG TPA: hypothetical protein VHB69_09095 [Mycobacteriales bacterium]|nr:hypothetical protein [Mycobacteriales bacterium]
MRSLRLLVPGLLFSTSSVFLSFGPAWAASTAVPAGHLAFITPRGALDVVAVLSDGTTTDPVQIAPVTTVAAPLNVVVTDLVVSADGSWLAWAEEVFKPDPTYGKVEVRQRIAVRNMTTGATTAINSDAAPLGFSGSQLVVEGARTARLVTNPSPHFVSLHEGNAFPVATYAGGVVDVRSKSTGRGDLDTEQLRLTSFSGHHTVLHTYQVGLDYRAVTANIDAVSPDGKELLVERGNHQDFDGLGPSSLFDEYAMSGGHERRELGEYGTKAAKWRLVDATFVGTQDTPWMALHSGYTKVANNDVVVRGVVVSFTGGRWKLQARDAIAVAGNPDGYVVVQPGTWREVKNAPDGEYDAVPSAPAVLDGPGGTHDLTSVEGSQLAWVGGALPTATPSAHAAVAGVVGSLAYVAAAGQGAAGQVDVVQVGADGLDLDAAADRPGVHRSWAADHQQPDGLLGRQVAGMAGVLAAHRLHRRRPRRHDERRDDSRPEGRW